MAPTPTRAALTDVTVDNVDALDCGVCYLPLKPPIFQCKVGHVLCSSCRDKLAPPQRCHICRTPTSAGYHRSHDMEKVLESIRVPCSNAAYGCIVKPVYYDKDVHLRSCQHAPCHCPLKACGFAGSTSKLLDHFAAVHRWPCTTARSQKTVVVHLRDGFNVASVRYGGQQHLFLLTVSPKPLGRGISVFWVHPQAPVDESSPVRGTLEFQIRLRYCRNNYGTGDMCRGHSQETKFRVAASDLSSGLPNSDDSYQFFLPSYVHPLNIDTITADFDAVIVTTIG